MPRLKDCPKNEQLAEKQSFKGNCEILKAIFQPCKSTILQYASNPGRGYLFYNPPINFYNVHALLWSVRVTAHLQLNKSKLVSLLDFLTL